MANPQTTTSSPRKFCDLLNKAFDYKPVNPDTNVDSNPYWPGVIIRNWDDGIDPGHKISIATMWQRNITAANQCYPFLRNGLDCFNDDWGGADGTAWQVPTLVAVYANVLDNGFFPIANGYPKEYYYHMYDIDTKTNETIYGCGVFYPHDGNSDKRSVPQFNWTQGGDGLWTAGPCPPAEFKDSSMDLNMGNPLTGGPDNGGGTGLHADDHFQEFTKEYKFLDQNSYLGYFWGINYDLKGDHDWDNYVDQFITAANKFDWKGEDSCAHWDFKADTIGWVNNPHDMIAIQNRLWERRAEWSRNPDVKTYWGWNEVPIVSAIANDPNYVDALIFVLPPDFNTTEELFKCTNEDQIKKHMITQIDFYRDKKCFDQKPMLFAKCVKRENSSDYFMYIFTEKLDLEKKYEITDDGWCYPKP